MRLVPGRALSSNARAFRLTLVHTGIPRPTPPFKPGDNDPGDGGLQKSLGFGEDVIQAGALFELGFIQRTLVNEDLCGFAALGSHFFDLARDASRPADGQNCFVIFCSHARDHHLNHSWRHSVQN
jgi:hypothetical protein